MGRSPRPDPDSTSQALASDDGVKTAALFDLPTWYARESGSGRGPRYELRHTSARMRPGSPASSSDLLRAVKDATGIADLGAHDTPRSRFVSVLLGLFRRFDEGAIDQARRSLSAFASLDAFTYKSRPSSSHYTAEWAQTERCLALASLTFHLFHRAFGDAACALAKSAITRCTELDDSPQLGRLVKVLVKAPGLDRDALMERLETQLRIAAALLTSGGGAAHAPAADSGE